jgi:SAM-dependent methyltransferase
MHSREERRRTFDEVAEQYDRYRPAYPERLIDDVQWLSGIPSGGQILEIGCGTGRATQAFLRRGFRLRCIEPGANLAAVTKRQCAGLGELRIDGTTFEQWSPEGQFDLVIAAQVFHLLDPATALTKAAQVLKPTGAIALFGNEPERPDSDVHRAVQAAYLQHAPELAIHKDDDAALEEQIDASGKFGTVVTARYRWQTNYSADDYVGLMNTQSPHRLLPPERRSALLEGIHAAIDAFGGHIAIEYVARLHLAKRRSA